MRLGIAVGLLVLVGCAGLDKPALESYDDIRAAIVVTTDPETGAVTANSAAASKEEIGQTMHLDRSGNQFDLSNASAQTSGRSLETAYVEGVRAKGGDVQLYIVSLERNPVARVETSERPWTVTDPDRHGFIGDPWRRTAMQLGELSFDCSSQRETCTRLSIDRMILTGEDVKALLASPREDIPVNFDSWRTADWRIDKDALLAVLDALVARERFQ